MQEIYKKLNKKFEMNWKWELQLGKGQIYAS